MIHLYWEAKVRESLSLPSPTISITICLWYFLSFKLSPQNFLSQFFFSCAVARYSCVCHLFFFQQCLQEFFPRIFTWFSACFENYSLHHSDTVLIIRPFLSFLRRVCRCHPRGLDACALSLNTWFVDPLMWVPLLSNPTNEILHMSIWLNN